MSAGNSRAAYMREYRERKRLEEDNCNNVPKRTKLNAERQREYRETQKNVYNEYMRNYRKRNAQEKAAGTLVPTINVENVMKLGFVLEELCTYLQLLPATFGNL
jgi:hypothetical protein